jgi:glutaredoxin
MNPTTPTEVQVITEMDVYEASVRKVVSRGNLNASPLAEPSYSWSDVEEQEARKPKVKEEPKVQEEPVLTESVNEKLDKLMTEIEDIVNKENNIKVDVELESDEDMPELGDSESDMPELVDSDSEMPGLVSESDDDMPDLVEESDSDSEDEEMMIAVFQRPSCPRCEAALKVLLNHDENVEDAEESEEEHTSDVEESSEDESDDSDSDYVPSESESESPRTVRQLRRWNTVEPVENKRTSCVPPLIQYIAIVLFVIHVLKFLLNEPSQRIRCYS